MEVFTEAVRGRTPQKEVEMNRTYEIMFIVRPDVEEAELDKLIETWLREDDREDGSPPARVHGQEIQ
jgi:hypothetical protein